MGLNGPGDLEKIHMLEKYWFLYENCLLMELKKMQETYLRTLTDGERSVIQRLYNIYKKFIDLFEWSRMFKYEFFRNNEGDYENDYDSEYDSKAAYELLQEYKQIFEDEYVYLRGSAYDELHEYIDRMHIMLSGEDVDICKLFDISPDLVKDQDWKWQEHLGWLCYKEIQGFKDIIDPYLMA